MQKINSDSIMILRRRNRRSTIRYRNTFASGITRITRLVSIVAIDPKSIKSQDTVPSPQYMHLP